MDNTEEAKRIVQASEAKRIVQASVQATLKFTFLSLLKIYYEPDGSIELMSIRQIQNQFYIHYNPNFVRTCSKKQLQKLIEHEFMHVIFSIKPVKEKEK